MTVRANKPAFNIREKIKELDYSEVPYEKMPPGSVIQYVTKAYHNTSGTITTLPLVKKLQYIQNIVRVRFIVKFFDHVNLVDGAAGSRQTIRRNGSDFAKVFNEDGSPEGLYTTTSQMGFYGSGNMDYGWVL